MVQRVVKESWSIYLEMIDGFPHDIDLCLSLVGLDFIVVIIICLRVVIYARICIHEVGGRNDRLEEQSEKSHRYSTYYESQKHK